MNIAKLLESSKFTWPNGAESLEVEFKAIIELISSLPESENLSNPIFERYAPLTKDEIDRQASREEILNGSMFVI